jgi:hypothetical protein
VLGGGSLLAMLIAAVALVLAFNVDERQLSDRDVQYANAVAAAALNAKASPTTSAASF